MTRIITYSLKPNSPRSDEYHQAIAAFAVSWLSRTTPRVLDLVNDFREYRRSRSETDRSEAEYAFELLALGVLLREHGQEAGRLPAWVEHLLGRLVDAQKQQPRLEKMIKTLRGWLGWILGGVPGRERSADRIGLLIAWLGANEETVKQERFEQWHDYFKSKGEPVAQTAVSRCLRLAGEFAETSQTALGKYTANVERFLAEEAPKHRCRYDARLLMRTRLEYHLGMLGTELLNQAYRQRFLSTPRKVVIVPPCMCAPVESCKAIETPLGARCQACTPGCRVNQVTKLGEKLGFRVTMIPDDVKVFGSGKDAESIGLVGISCALTNWNGGWEAGSLEIPAQGLLLDYVGCKIHWDRVGIPTDTNFKKLQEIVGV